MESGVFEDLFRALEKNPAPRWIFGERVSLGGKEAVPVSEFRLVVELPSGGAVEGQPPPSATLRMDGRPVGFLAEHEGAIAFVPIPSASGGDDEACDRAPRWADDLFRRLDEVRYVCSRRERDEEDRDACCRSRREFDDAPNERRPRRDYDDRRRD